MLSNRLPNLIFVLAAEQSSTINVLIVKKSHSLLCHIVNIVGQRWIIRRILVSMTRNEDFCILLIYNLEMALKNE